MKKLERIIWIPTTIAVNAGIVSLIILSASRIPYEFFAHTLTAIIEHTSPIIKRITPKRIPFSTVKNLPSFPTGLTGMNPVERAYPSVNLENITMFTPNSIIADE